MKFSFSLFVGGEKSRIFRYGLTEDFLSKGLKTKGGRERTAPPSMGERVKPIYIVCMMSILFVTSIYKYLSQYGGESLQG